MKKQIQRLTQIAVMLFVFGMMLPQLKAQPIGSQIRLGADSTISYWNGSAWITIAPGLPGQSLQFINGIPTWIYNPQAPVHDVDGYSYDTIIIGTQIWLKQNLNVTHYRNGDAITNESGILSTEAYCNYNGNTSNATIYGRLYNWYAVVDPRNLCPTGWHVPSDAEWTTLTDYLGGISIAGGKLKEVGTTHWDSPNTGATNETGFTALPGGDRDYGGSYAWLNYYGVWWSSTNSNTTEAWYRLMGSTLDNVVRDFYFKENGYSVRCLKD